jgi:hypothetical protein
MKKNLSKVILKEKVRRFFDVVSDQTADGLLKGFHYNANLELFLSIYSILKCHID